MNIDGTKYTFSGAPAHQLAAWNGRNALTAVIHFFDNVDGIRSNLLPRRASRAIIEGGAAPNVVPDRTVADFYIRYPDQVYRPRRRSSWTTPRRPRRSTGTKVKIDHYGQPRDGISIGTLAGSASRT